MAKNIILHVRLLALAIVALCVGCSASVETTQPDQCAAYDACAAQPGSIFSCDEYGCACAGPIHPGPNEPVRCQPLPDKCYISGTPAKVVSTADGTFCCTIQCFWLNDPAVSLTAPEGAQ